MRWWKRLGEWFRSRRQQEKLVETPKAEKSFFLYRERVPEVLTRMRREQGIPLKDLELVLIDNEEEPAWQVQAVLDKLVPGLNVLYLVTDRKEEFEELAEELFDSQGLIVVMTDPEAENPAGNLILDLHDWEMHLDIIS